MLLYSYEWLLTAASDYCIWKTTSTTERYRAIVRCLILHRKHLQPRNYRTVAVAAGARRYLLMTSLNGDLSLRFECLCNSITALSKGDTNSYPFPQPVTL